MVISVKELDVTNKFNSRRPLLERALLSISDVVLGISEGGGQLNQHVKISVLEIYCWPQQSLYLVTPLPKLVNKFTIHFKESVQPIPDPIHYTYCRRLLGKNEETTVEGT